MSKHFKNLPAELEQYNPESLERYTNSFETRDENGLLHSFDGEPSFVKVTGRQKQLRWFCHGEAYREEDKPSSIDASISYYVTSNYNRVTSSFADSPASIRLTEEGWELTWRKDGELHRDNDLPAEIAWIKDFVTDKPVMEHEGYYLNGQAHRSGGLPSVIADRSFRWYVKDVMHNRHGLVFFHDDGTQQVSKRWGLYGIMIPESMFITFKEMEQNLPSWAAFLAAFEILKVEDLQKFLKDTNCRASLPLPWILRSLGVTNEVLLKKINRLSRKTKSVEYSSHLTYDRTQLETLIDIVTFEMEEDLIKTKKKAPQC